MRSFLRRAGAPRQRSTRRKRDSARARAQLHVTCLLHVVCGCTLVAQLHLTCLLPCFAAVRACCVAYCWSFAVFCSCPRVLNCILLAFCGVLQLYARAVLHYTFPFAVFCSCTHVLCCIILPFCSVLQLYARAMLHSTCLLPCFAAVHSCPVALWLPFAVVCSFTRVHNCLLSWFAAVRSCLVALWLPFGVICCTRTGMQCCILVAWFGVCCSCTHLLCCISIPRAVLQSVAFLSVCCILVAIFRLVHWSSLSCDFAPPPVLPVNKKQSCSSAKNHLGDNRWRENVSKWKKNPVPYFLSCTVNVYWQVWSRRVFRLNYCAMLEIYDFMIILSELIVPISLARSFLFFIFLTIFSSFFDFNLSLTIWNGIAFLNLFFLLKLTSFYCENFSVVMCVTTKLN